MKSNAITIILSLILSLHRVESWNTDELEVFDAVDEVKQNFYTLLDIPQNAGLAEIKKSFRKLSLALHPDHNPSPTADQEFRHLVLVYDILKSPEKRQYYDNILINGLPDWRQAVYYYRRVRKMGLQEMCLILAVIISIGQYLVAWAAYMEKKLTLKELLKSKDKKQLKRPNKKNKVELLYSDEIIQSAISKPSVRNTLPFQICYLVKGLTMYIIMLSVTTVKDYWNSEPSVKEPVRPRPETQPRPHHEKPKRVDFVPELIKDLRDSPVSSSPKGTSVVTESAPVISGGLWTDDDILTLIKLVKKHPAGENERWVKIATAMCRTVAEVTHMANKIKENDFRIPTESEEAPDVVEEPKKMKTKGGKLGVKISEDAGDSEKSSPWTQIQQKAFEAALNKYSKKGAGDRWEKIANCVPGKTKEDCILRYKKISAVVRQRKEQEENNQETQQTEENQQENLEDKEELEQRE